jgi:hypothetical protein
VVAWLLNCFPRTGGAKRYNPNKSRSSREARWNAVKETRQPHRRRCR